MSRTIQHLRRTLLPCTALAAFAALTLSAAAQVTSAQQSAIRSNCRSDFMSHCSGVTPGGKDALACLQKNVAKLSGGCQTAVRATIPAEAAPKVAAPAAAPPPPPPAAAAEPAPAAKPATIVSAPPPKAHTAKKPDEETGDRSRRSGRPGAAGCGNRSADCSSAERNALELPQRLHVTMLGRHAGRQGCTRLPAEQRRQSFAGLQAGRERDHAWGRPGACSGGRSRTCGSGAGAGLGRKRIRAGRHADHQGLRAHYPDAVPRDDIRYAPQGRLLGRLRKIRTLRRTALRDRLESVGALALTRRLPPTPDQADKKPCIFRCRAFRIERMAMAGQCTIMPVKT